VGKNVFLQKNVSHDHNFAKIFEKNVLPFWEEKRCKTPNSMGVLALFEFERSIAPLQNTRNTLCCNCRKCYPWRLTISYQTSNENIKSKKVIECFILKIDKIFANSDKILSTFSLDFLRSFQWCIPKPLFSKCKELKPTIL